MTTGNNFTERKYQAYELDGGYPPGNYPHADDANIVKSRAFVTWSGTDRPKIKKSLRTSVEVKHLYFQTRKGLQVTKTVQKIRFKREWVQPPKRARAEAEHPFSKSGYTWGALEFRRKNLLNTGPPYYERNYFAVQGGDLLLGTWDSNIDIALAGKLREAVAGTDFNVGVTLGEGREALAMISNSAYRIGNALRAVRRFDFVSAHRFLFQGTLNQVASAQAKKTKVKTSGRFEPYRARDYSWTEDVASNWLQLQYGWLPLLNDAYNAAGFLGHVLNTPAEQVVRVSIGRPGRAYWSSASPVNYAAKALKSRDQVWVKAKIREKNVPQLAGLLDPLSVAWELVPYSFVVDWFIPIGNWLSARGLVQSIDATYVVSRLRKAECRTYQITSGAFSPLKDGYFTRFEFTRSVSSSFTIPLPSFKPLGKVASWQHAANAVALLTRPLLGAESKFTGQSKSPSVGSPDRNKAAFRSLARETLETGWRHDAKNLKRKALGLPHFSNRQSG